MDYVSIKDERAALAALLEQLEGLTVYPYWPENIETIAALIRPVRRPEVAMSSEPVRQYEVEILDLAGDQASSQELIDEFLEEYGPKSIRQLVDSDPTLGGLVGQVVYQGWKDYGGRRTEAAAFIGAIIVLDVYPRSEY